MQTERMFLLTNDPISLLIAYMQMKVFELFVRNFPFDDATTAAAAAADVTASNSQSIPIRMEFSLSFFFSSLELIITSFNEILFAV